MRTIHSKKLVKNLSLLGLFLVVPLSQNVLADEHEVACSKHVQDKISWNYDGQNHWDSANIETLCKGTSAPKEPGECFHKVMTGNVKWGSDDKWEWKNAVSLCAGTSNADERISCFKQRMTDGVEWNAAILQCQSSGKIIFN
ncbi:MAG: hypothetical protein Q8Q40_10775 [Methylococcaceae bacterium]|nr:hypothetical protein [Methylococcaceae bacterium]